MWLDPSKATLALLCISGATTVMRRQLAAIDQTGAAPTRRNILFNMLAAAALAAAVAVSALWLAIH